MILPKCKRRICLNAGHFLQDKGACVSLSGGQTINENYEVMKIRDYLVPMLKMEGFEVIAIPDNLNLAESIDLANAIVRDLNDGFCLDIHLNAKGYSIIEEISGVECYSGGSKVSISIGETLSRNLAKELGLSDRGWRASSSSAVGSLGWLWKTKGWSAVIECLYIDSEIDRKLIIEGKHKQIAEGICNGIKELFGITPEVVPARVFLMQRLVALYQELLKLLNKQKLGNMNTRLLRSSVDSESWSLTVKSLAVAFLPVLKNLFGIELVSDEVNKVIDALFTLGSLIFALYGYLRVKNVLGRALYTDGGKEPANSK